MFQDTRPAELDPLATGDHWAEFRVSGTKPVLALLRELRDGQIPVILNAPDGASITTTLWALDPERGRLTFSASNGNAASGDMLARIVEADEAVAVAYLEAIKLQFELPGIVLVRGQGGVALQCGWPEHVYRFQRRQAYRVRPTGRSGPVARLRHPSLPEMQLKLRVLDLSIGGVALWLPGNVPPLQAGTVISGVQVELDAETGFVATISLQHVCAPSGGNAAGAGTLEPGTGPGQRLGCEWKQLPAGGERTLQRWIDRTQQRRRLLEL